MATESNGSKLNAILEREHLSRPEFCRITGIPYRTAQNWLLPDDNPQHHEPPAWVVPMVDCYLQHRNDQ